MSNFFSNFINGFAFGMLANNPFFGGCCGFGFGMYPMFGRVDFGGFANPFPSVFGNMGYSSMTAQIPPSTFANAGFPAVDFRGVCQTIWDTYADPDSDYNKQMREAYKQMEEQAKKRTDSSGKRQYIPQIEFPFSSFYMPSSVSMNPWVTGYMGDYFVTKRTDEKKADNKDNENTKSYVSKYSNDKYFSKMLDFVFEHEGGYVNHPNDRGGSTNMGVTQTTYDGYRTQKGLSKRNVKQLSKEEATEIYHNIYKESGADKISNPRLAMCVFDWANHSGAKNEALQRALKECNGDVNKFIKKRSDFLHKLIEKDPTQEVFRKGWDNRIRDLNTYVTKLPSCYA